MTGTVEALYRYPVKGLSPESLDEVDLARGQTLPFDRAWAIENGPGRFDPEAPRHLPKTVFLMLMRDERLATLETTFSDDTGVLTIKRAGKQVARGQLSTTIGRQLIEQFIAAYMKDSLRGAPRIVEAPGHSFSDVAEKCVHIVNRASLRELERIAGRTIDARRFRPNLVLDGLAPWAEFDWLGRDLTIGTTRLQVFKRTTRCAATNVDPVTAARDMAIPSLLLRTWGHSDFGIYATVENDGKIKVGDPVEPPT